MLAALALLFHLPLRYLTTWLWTLKATLWNEDTSMVSASHLRARSEALPTKPMPMLTDLPMSHAGDTPWTQGEIPEYKSEELVDILFLVLSIAIPFVIYLTFACVYKQKVANRRPVFHVTSDSTVPDFRFDVFSCFDDKQVCYHAFCCPATRAGDTHTGAGTWSFWYVILWFILSTLIGRVISGFIEGDIGYLAAAIVLALMMASKRQQLKAKLGIDPGSFVNDFLLWWCCTPCVIAQEARQVDEASGVEVRCCCNLLQLRATPDQPLLGMPVQHDTTVEVTLPNQAQMQPPAVGPSTTTVVPPLPGEADLESGAEPCQLREEQHHWNASA